MNSQILILQKTIHNLQMYIKGLDTERESLAYLADTAKDPSAKARIKQIDSDLDLRRQDLQNELQRLDYARIEKTNAQRDQAGAQLDSMRKSFYQMQLEALRLRQQEFELSDQLYDLAVQRADISKHVLDLQVELKKRIGDHESIVLYLVYPGDNDAIRVKVKLAIQELSKVTT